MIDDDGFVERPVVTPKGYSAKVNSLLEKLRRTAENGMAIPVEKNTGEIGGIRTALKKYGYQLHSKRTGPASCIVWATKIEDGVPR